jgi:outer membrane protein assembly factor BamB
LNANKKPVITTLALILIITLSILTVARAHDPPWTIKTFCYLSASPTTVGVNQDIILYMWLNMQPPTASGGWGDRWEDFTVTITKPDGTTQTLGPYFSDPIGFSWATYTPTQVGEYAFKANFPGQTLAGDNLDPNSFGGLDFIGDYFEPSTSATTTVTVQEEAIPDYPSAPIPTDGWSRPINAQHRDWWSISGNWLSVPGGFFGWNRAYPPDKFAKYTQGPASSHILWTNPITIGGLVGGEIGVNAYHAGNAYEGRWLPPVIINGILYYNKYQGGFGVPNMPGYIAVDIRTGEEVYYNPETKIDFGQIYQYDSPNQHGSFAYLWREESSFFAGTSWHCYDAYSGDWWYTIENVPGGSFSRSDDGSLLMYGLDTNADRLTLWNSSAIVDLLAGPTGTNAWQWRPYKKTVDGADGYVWNVSIPSDLAGGINHVLEDRIIGSTGLGRDGWLNLGTDAYTVWCISIKPGQEGQLLWKKDYTGVGDGVTLNMGPASVESGVFIIQGVETINYYGYDIDTGNQVWGPTEQQVAWDFTVGTVAEIADGRFYSCGWGGILYCRDAATGELLWTAEAEDPYYQEAKWGGNYPIDIWFITEEYIYVGAGEHSPDDPKERNAPTLCIDVETGEVVWRIPFYSSHWALNPAIADGIITYLNAYDNQIYAIGRGPSATTVRAEPKVIVEGSSVIIDGTVTDQSPGAKDTPAISDEDMDEWMKYQYMQFPIPTNAQGVEVTLDTIDPNGNFIHIGTATSDMSGFYSYMFTPDISGKYTIIATFAGSESYFSSYAETSIGVEEAPAPPLEPTPTPAPMTDTYLAGSTIAIIAAIGIAVFLLLRRK